MSGSAIKSVKKAAKNRILVKQVLVNTGTGVRSPAGKNMIASPNIRLVQVKAIVYLIGQLAGSGCLNR
ncbi:hypothetical protein [Aeromonas jandaei]|uniref:hypothetical protein n=1 Tax=Aeromonas jandaei TaxID=650 RepID=UPI001C0577CB|nr:hypothetical protein [Aeromonas jandaei]QWL66471.1 hypothetical protein HQ398_09910 [Aeromonas jandaei]